MEVHKPKFITIIVLVLSLMIILGACEETPDLHTLTIETEGEGTTDPEPGTYEYEYGTTVENIEAIPGDGHKFVEWKGNVQEPNEPETSVLMESDKTITAVFEEKPPTEYELELIGENITSEPEEGYIEKDTEVTVEVEPENGKQVDSFEVNEEEKKSELLDTPKNEYTFILTEDTTVEVVYIHPAYFEVELVENKSIFNVGYGQEFKIVTDIKNLGDVTASQQIEAIVNEETRKSKEITLKGSEKKEITMEFESKVEDDGQVIEINSEDENKSHKLEVKTDEIEKEEEFKAASDEEFDHLFIDQGSLAIKYIDNAEILSLPEKVDAAEGNYVERYADEIELKEKGSFIEEIEFGLILDFSEEILQDMRGDDAGGPMTFELLDDERNILTEFTVDPEVQ